VSTILEARQQGLVYPVRVGPSARGLAEFTEGRDRVALVTCARVLATPHGRRIAATLAGTAPLATTVVLPDGERGKTLAILERSATRLLHAGLTRRSLVVALGGGAVTDAAGFLSAVFMRGLDWLAVPTTVLAMVDAALGGKTAVNLPLAKNAVGAFHPPVGVLSDPASLVTLPPRELRSGLGEVLKYGFLRPDLLPRLDARARAGRVDERTIADCARVKLEIVERDPREKAERKLLNLGHTFGHGVEAAGGFRRWTHGESVAVGMAFAFRLARILGRVGDAEVERVESALVGAGLPVRVPPSAARKARLLMAHDKKRSSSGLLWVLPIRRPRGWAVEWDVVADPAAVGEAAREIGRPG
jgi:3-dehydroquinate synthase